MKKTNRVLSDELLFKYFDGQLTETEASKVQGLLNRDPVAFKLYTILLRLKAAEPTPRELADFETEHTFTPPAVIVQQLNLPAKKGSETPADIFTRLHPIWVWIQNFEPPVKGLRKFWRLIFKKIKGQ